MDREYSEDQVEYSSGELKEKFESARLANVGITGQGLFSTPFAEKAFRTQRLAHPLGKCAVRVDRLFERAIPALPKALGWNLIAAGQKPE
ncbi:MAG: hypothetical protein AAFX93_04685 [Verrucomicrobiota bacterium]